MKPIEYPRCPVCNALLIIVGKHYRCVIHGPQDPA